MRLPTLFRCVCLFVSLSALLPVAPARAGEPPTAPILRVETGTHTATIKRIGVDDANRFLVTGSKDKTVRVWDLATGHLLRTLRPPIDSGGDGKIYAVAISPNGGTIACAGWTGYDWDGSEYIYLFDRASGRMERRIAGLPISIGDMVFSSDGRYLATVLIGNGLRVYRSGDGGLAGQDADYGDQSYGVDFDRAGRLVTTCYDGFLRLYNADFKLIAKKKAPGGSQPVSARFSPDGSQIAVGFDDSNRVNVLSGQDLSFRFSTNTDGIANGRNLDKVAWSADGEMLYAGGSGVNDQNMRVIRRWDQGGRGGYTDLPTAGDTIMDLRPLHGGGIAWCSAEPSWGIFEVHGQPSALLT